MYASPGQAGPGHTHRRMPDRHEAQTVAVTLEGLGCEWAPKLAAGWATLRERSSAGRSAQAGTVGGWGAYLREAQNRCRTKEHGHGRVCRARLEHQPGGHQRGLGLLTWSHPHQHLQFLGNSSYQHEGPLGGYS